MSDSSAPQSAQADLPGRPKTNHAPGGAGRADIAADITILAGVGDKNVMSAGGAAGTGKSVRQDAACDMAMEFPLGRRGRHLAGPVIVKRQSGR